MLISYERPEMVLKRWSLSIPTERWCLRRLRVVLSFFRFIGVRLVEGFSGITARRIGLRRFRSLVLILDVL